MIEEKMTVSADEKFPLNALLTLPDNLNGKVPAAVLVHGSGPNDMNEQVKKTALFKDLVEALAVRGVAGLRYDKRTFVYGKEMVNDKALSVREETIDDAIAAANLLQADARIDADKIFIIGHSMGAMLAPRIDAEGGNFAGLILLAGSPRKLEEISLSQNEEALAELDETTRKQYEPQVAALKASYQKMYELTDEEAQEIEIMPHLKAYYLKEWGEHPAEHYLSNLTKPILILQGDKDFHVSVDKDFAAYKTLMIGKPNAMFRLYPNLSHVFMPSQGKTIKDGLAEYDADIHLAPEVADDIVKFIKEI
ncbi:MAG: alpha/beta fold hydrolase [Streptococcaceae bacterium]|nr:alpha/beta fold hydrolase [Streptococcaceae bacterium]